MEANSPVLWIRDSLTVQTGKSRFLYIRKVTRSQAGNYICVSLTLNGNFSSPITTVNVLCEFLLCVLRATEWLLNKILYNLLFMLIELWNKSVKKFPQVC